MIVQVTEEVVDLEVAEQVHGHPEVEVVTLVELANILWVTPVKDVPEVVVVHTTQELTKITKPV